MGTTTEATHSLSFPTCIGNMDVPYLYIEAATIQELRNEHDHYVIAD